MPVDYAKGDKSVNAVRARKFEYVNHSPPVEKPVEAPMEAAFSCNTCDFETTDEVKMQEHVKTHEAPKEEKVEEKPKKRGRKKKAEQ